MRRLQTLEREHKILVRFGAAVSSQTRLEPLLKLLADEVRQLLNAQRCTVFLLDPQTQELRSKLAHGLKALELRLPLGRGIIGAVAKTGRPLLIPKAYRDPRFDPSSDKKSGYRTRNLLAVPLKNREGKILGVFEVLNKKRGTFSREDCGLLQLLAAIASGAIENAKLCEELRDSHLETIYRLAMIAEYRDQEDTALHLRHISQYAAVVAENLGLDPGTVEEIRYASPLHDIGKVAIPDAILLKPGKLTEEEYAEMKKHPAYGARILENAQTTLLQMAHRIALAHHESFDGTGYPKRLKGEEIPWEARIVSVVDVFDALATRRVYKPAWEPQEAFRYIETKAGTQFDPAAVEGFKKGFPEILELLRTDVIARPASC
ncbi:MAG: GAF domain-containing protein [Elusimicrobia bacterium]|nr:GAF domain-containing protein [Elusimicrobiota bacterium]